MILTINIKKLDVTDRDSVFKVVIKQLLILEHLILSLTVLEIW
ncbi:hypothetical protein [Virgibacillus sp. YIM 98842]|nr:hypothetical protein [Virgibacillus sp. YIM 98842]